MRDCSPLIELMNGTLPVLSMTACTPASRASGLAESTMSWVSVTPATVPMSQSRSSTSLPPATPPLMSTTLAPASTCSLARPAMKSASRAWMASPTCLRVPLIDSPINSISTTSTAMFGRTEVRVYAKGRWSSTGAAEIACGEAGRRHRPTAPRSRRHDPVGRTAPPVPAAALVGDRQPRYTPVAVAPVFHHDDVVVAVEEAREVLEEPVSRRARHHQAADLGVHHPSHVPAYDRRPPAVAVVSRGSSPRWTRPMPSVAVAPDTARAASHPDVMYTVLVRGRPRPTVPVP